MLDVETVKKYGRSIISLDGERAYLDGPLNSKEEITKAKISSLLYEDALAELYLNQNPNDGNQTLDDLISKQIATYGLGNRISSTEESHFIENLLSSNGHFEVTIDDKLTTSKYRLLARTEKGRGLAILEYKANNLGFTIDNFKFSHENSKLIVTFDKVPLEKKIETSSKTIFDLQGEEKIEYARKELAASREIQDEVMTKYWQDIVDNLTSKLIPKKDSNLSHAITENVPVNQEAVSSQKDKHNEKGMIQEEDQLDYAERQFKLAMESHNEETANFWQSVIEALKAKHRIHPEEDSIRQYYKSFTEAKNLGQYEMANFYGKTIEPLFNEHPLTTTPDEWNDLSNSDKGKYMTLKKISADVSNKRDEYDYWDVSLQTMNNPMLESDSKM